MSVLPDAYKNGDCMRGNQRANEDCCPGACDVAGGGASGKGSGSSKKILQPRLAGLPDCGGAEHQIRVGGLGYDV